MKTILVIDDEQEIAELLKKRLEHHHYRVIIAFDGEEGYSKYSKEHPDLILLDLVLPKISGYEVCRRIRMDNEDQTPIFMLTGKREDSDRIIGRVKGADRYITKPFQLEPLLQEIKSFLN